MILAAVSDHAADAVVVWFARQVGAVSEGLDRAAATATAVEDAAAAAVVAEVAEVAAVVG